MDEAALKVLKAAEETKQLLHQKEEVLSSIRGEFEQKSKEVNLQRPLSWNSFPSCSFVSGCPDMHVLIVNANFGAHGIAAIRQMQLGVQLRRLS